MLEGLGADITDFFNHMWKNYVFLVTPSLLVIPELCVVRGRRHRLLCSVAVWKSGLI